MRKTIKFLFLFVIFGLIFTFVSCVESNNPGQDDEPKIDDPLEVKLDVPTNLKVEVLNDLVKITYKVVENASFHMVLIRNDKKEVVKQQKLGMFDSTYVFYQKDLKDGNYTVSAYAIGDGTKYLDSTETEAVSLTIKTETVTPDPDPDPNPVLTPYYKAAEGKKGNELLKSLRTIITDTHKKVTSYADCKKYLQNADEDPKNSNNMILFYTGESIKKTDNMNIWNREHVWAQSLGWFKTSQAGADLHHIRPCNPKVNSSRGNQKFGTGSSYYTPTDEYKGDVARIIFYLKTRYSQADSYDFPRIAQSLKLLLEWNKLDPVSELEVNRNNYIAKIQGNRNPFIDYPEFANMIWG
ncbi:MAG: endonuclease [Bacilli bacterium]|nr:endonuclease [Bacilli bacterium]